MGPVGEVVDRDDAPRNGPKSAFPRSIESVVVNDEKVDGARPERRACFFCVAFLRHTQPAGVVVFSDGTVALGPRQPSETEASAADACIPAVSLITNDEGDLCPTRAQLAGERDTADEMPAADAG